MQYSSVPLLISACATLAAADKAEFPLVWICLGITAAGIILATYIAYRRPREEIRFPSNPNQKDDDGDADDGTHAREESAVELDEVGAAEMEPMHEDGEPVPREAKSEAPGDSLPPPRLMPPLLPKLRGNELWQQHERDRKYAVHRQRVLKPIQGVDNTTPASCAFTRHIGTPPRTRRDKEVERENEHIVHRMIRIMESPSCIDNHGPPKDERRLVYAQRARDFDQKRIAYENAQLLKRLERTRPTYRTAKYEADRRRNEALAERISRYPYQPMDQRSCGMYSRMNPEPC